MVKTRSTIPAAPPGDLLAEIQHLFRKLGLYGQKVPLTHHSRKYVTLCDDHAFSIYRVNEKGHLPPGAPGWPVCLVTADTAVDEYSHPALEEDDFASGLTIQDWLHLIEEKFGKR